MHKLYVITALSYDGLQVQYQSTRTSPVLLSEKFSIKDNQNNENIMSEKKVQFTFCPGKLLC